MNFGSVLFSIFVYSVLLLISVSDIRGQIIPDILVILLAIGAVLSDVLTGRAGILNRFVLFAVVFLFLFLIRYFTHGLGFGDVKLCSVISYIGGFWVFLISLFTACILGICAFGIFSLHKKGIRRVPFAPFVSVGFLAGQAVERFLL